MAQWIALQLIFEVCAGKKGYEGGIEGERHIGARVRHINNFGKRLKKFLGEQGVEGEGKG